MFQVITVIFMLHWNLPPLSQGSLASLCIYTPIIVMLLVCHSAGHRVGVALIANYSFNIKPMNLGELFISVPCHFDSYHILHFNGCHEPHVHLCSIFFHGTCRQSWDSRHTGPSRACVVVSLIAYFCAQWGRRPEADCLLPTEKFHNSSTMHFLEYFLVVIKHEWRDLLERKKMRNIFKSPCRWIVTDTLTALTLEWWEYSEFSLLVSHLRPSFWFDLFCF